MATKSTAKRKPALVPVKATKTRLTKSMRVTLHRYMLARSSTSNRRALARILL
jgi:hypothetical protein